MFSFIKRKKLNIRFLQCFLYMYKVEIDNKHSVKYSTDDFLRHPAK